jgi:type VI secretion system secreted protein Hcp
VAVDVFLKLDGIEGESQDARHRGEIDVDTYSWGAANPVGHTGTGTGAGSGRVTFQDFSFTAPVSKASPKLFLACASGQHVRSAVLTVRKSGAQQQDFLKVTMTDVTVSGYTQAADGDATVPLDLVTLTFARFQVSYAAQRSDGSLETPITAGWDLKTNTGF